MGNKIVSREGFISDNLVNIGKRLQINYDLQNPASEEKLEPPEENNNPVVSKDENYTAAKRLANELRDRIGYDTALVKSHVESLENRRVELERCLDFLNGIADEVNNVNLSSSDVLPYLGDIRYRLFVSTGKMQALLEARSGGADNSVSGFETKPLKALFRETLPIAVAIFVSGILICGAIIFSMY